MRRSPTRGENRLWSWLRGRRFDGCKFKRQFPIGRYIVDFYCAELKVAIELDGTHHRQPGMLDYDARRTAYLDSLGIRIIRVPNELLIRDAPLVGDMIHAALGPSLKPSAVADPPHPPSALCELEHR